MVACTQQRRFAALAVAAALLASFGPATALPNGFGAKPGMGWEGDYGDPRAVGPGRGNASYIAAIATFMATERAFGASGNMTMHELGYWYVNPSSSWDEFNRSASGQLVPNHLLYPDGIEPTVAHIHSLGLGYGTYGDWGSKDCDGRPGQAGHEASDAAYFASIGVDWLKTDSCYGVPGGSITHYAKMRDALNATGRPIWLALCGWAPYYASQEGAGNALANSARIGPDTGGGWQAVLKNIDNTKGIGKFAGATPQGGYWNDGSLQLSPGTGCPAPRKCTSAQQCGGGAKCVAGFCAGGTSSSAACMTHARHRTMFSAWCVLGLNLVTTGNLPLIHKLDPYVTETWTNDEAIAVNQDAASWSQARPGQRLDSGAPLASSASSALHASGDSSYAKAHVAECGGEPDMQLWTLSNSTVFNKATREYVAMAGCQSELIYDGCSFNPTTITCAGRGNYSHFKFSLAADSTLRSHYQAGLCVTLNPDQTLSALECASPPSMAQKWTHTPSGQLQTGTGHCLTSGAAAPKARNTTAVFGRPLTSFVSPEAGAYALLFVNDGEATAEVTCDAGCCARMGLPAGFSHLAYLRDLWSHQPIAPAAVNMRDGLGFSISVEGGGGSRLLKLCSTKGECDLRASARIDLSDSSPSSPVSPAGQGPCDIYRAAGTPCVAAHSTVRALYASYTGGLYDVKRVSDGKIATINASVGGRADSAAQDTFCSGGGGGALDNRSTSIIDPLSCCFTKEPESAKLPNVCFGGYAVKTEAANSSVCAAKCFADPKCVQFASATPTYGDPHACRLSYTCTAPTSFLAGFDGYLRDLSKAGCALPSFGCTIARIVDQSGNQNHLVTAPAGSAHGAADNGANATALKTSSNGHPVYGVLTERGTGPGRAHSGTGYRCDNTTKVAKGDEPETIYMVVEGRRYNSGCCFDYGNAEVDNHADGKGAMEAVYWGNASAPGWSRGAGTGPWVMVDLENGVWAGNSTPVTATNTPIVADFVTAMAKGKAGQFALKGGDANSGHLKLMYEGPRPSGYEVMAKQGGIILGIGGDNSDAAVGSFLEGVITQGYSTDAADDAVQRNIMGVGYGK
jgi:hypothetical protein